MHEYLNTKVGKLEELVSLIDFHVAKLHEMKSRLKVLRWNAGLVDLHALSNLSNNTYII